MTRSFFPAVLFAAGFFGVAAGCSGSSGSGGALSIVSCSLGCSGSGAGGDGQITCGIADVFLNGEVRISFSDAVDASSLSVFTLQVTETGTGKTPSAKRFVDPSDPRVVVYRPTMSFDSAGSPVYGLASGASYTLKLPGVIEDPGASYVRSSSGKANEHRMLCTLDASLGVLDSKPGAPAVSVTVDLVTEYDGSGEPSAFAVDQPADGATGVYRFSTVTFEFDDLMNPATLVNPVTGVSNGISLAIDADGDISDPSDQVEVQGVFSISLDQEAKTTRVVFESELGFPSAGSDPLVPRRIAVKFLPSISDLGGHALVDASTVVFVPEAISFEELVVREDFSFTNHEDDHGGGADWGGVAQGVLLAGQGGGSGRLGPLRLLQGQVLQLNTDHEDFAGVDPATWNPVQALDAVFKDGSFTVPPVEEGLFEFSSLEVSTGARLELRGTRPARLFVRGDATVRGEVDVSGPPPPLHSSLSIFGGVPAQPGPAAGAGGIGGRMPTWVGFEGIGGTITPPPPQPPAPTLAELNGGAAPGVADNLLNPTGSFGGGGGGRAWPQPTASHPEFHLPVSPSDLTGIQWDPLFICATLMKGTVGAGGAFGLNGTPGINVPMPQGFVPVVEGPSATPGQASSLGLGIGSDPLLPQRLLSPEAGFLHGGAGGGGGGSHLLFTRTNGSILVDCLVMAFPLGAPAKINFYQQCSAACGGGGGGALQLQAGRRASIEGKLDATGGAGGGKTPDGNATSGGGGAGGALLVQSPDISILGGLGRLDVSGGAGGFGAGASTGGRGGAGLVRLETDAGLEFSTLKTTVAPSATDLALSGATTGDIVSLGPLALDPIGPNGMSGAQSCWFKPEGSFFLLEFLEDEVDAGTGEVLVPGFDLRVLPLPLALGEQSFRGPNDLFAQSLEELLGTELGSAPFVVRFQGARAVKQINDPCTVELEGPDADIELGSLTGWVKHPAELNAYYEDPSLRPNMFRFQIVFDRTQPAAGVIAGITELTVRVLPD